MIEVGSGEKALDLTANRTTLEKYQIAWVCNFQELFHINGVLKYESNWEIIITLVWSSLNLAFSFLTLS
jgi:hypothetical protein